MKYSLKAIAVLFVMLITAAEGFAQLSFTDSGQRLGNGTSNSVALGDIDNDGDLDGDGDLDAFAANNGPNKAWINGFVTSVQKDKGPINRK